MLRLIPKSLRRIARAVFHIVPLALITGCDRPPIAQSDADRYQMAVYYNSERPAEDRRSDVRRKPVELLRFAGVQPGMTVIDLCGGGGWFTELLAHVVGPTGRIIIVNPTLFTDIAGEELTKRLQGNRLANVTRVDSTWTNMQIPEGADIIWLGLAYHDIYVPRPDKPEWQADPVSFHAQVLAALKPGGLLLVTDHAAPVGTGKESAGTLHRIDEEFARRDFESAGFEFVSESDLLRNPADDYSKSIWAEGIMGNTDQFVYLFRKPL